MHIVIGSIIHESNSFSPQATDLSAFADSELLLGHEIIDHHAGRGTEIGGILHLAAHRGIDVTPTVSATAMPAGPVTDEAFEFLSDKLLDGIKAAGGAVDAVLLVLHGAMLTETVDDPEGLLLSHVRDLLGPEVPVGMTLDHHANVTARMAEFADFFVAYRTHPHTDRFEVGVQAAELVRRMADEGLQPVMRVKKVPMLLCQESSPTARGPLVERIEQLEKKDKVLSASFCIGYSFADFAEVGPCAAVVTDADADLAERDAADFAGLMWSLRDKFSPPVPTMDDAIDEALGGEGGPYVLCDLGDCLLAGGTGDVTALLAALLRRRAENACMMLVDAAAV
ncbi:MAG: M81 family metallopeptidase, partial [Phycisphaerae bacterium]|nr:M81 family metallopeptidase [Phycisphaerae bacterium]